jgi:tetratricopeptide (TPR) repeat protein
MAVNHRRATHRWLGCLVALVFTVVAARAAQATDTRELKAREEFAAGRFQQALDIFAKLYAETLHPVYLRNIGRCYQNLGDADHAIISFRDYLRKHENISAKERAEIEGFIAEMEQLKKQKGGGAVATDEASPAPPSESIVTPLPAAPEPKSSGAAPEALVTAPAATAREEAPPIYTRWWFWTLVGAAAVGAGLGIAAATGMLTTTQEGSCASGFDCQPR